MALVVDAGPLYASIDRRDRDHARSRSLLEGTSEELIIPAPVLVEVDYLLARGRAPGSLFVALLDEIARGAFTALHLETEDYARVREVVERYADSDVGFVDAAVLAIVERLGEPKLATLDRRHFGRMRPRHIEALTLLPD